MRKCGLAHVVTGVDVGAMGYEELGRPFAGQGGGKDQRGLVPVVLGIHVGGVVRKLLGEAHVSRL